MAAPTSSSTEAQLTQAVNHLQTLLSQASANTDQIPIVAAKYLAALDVMTSLPSFESANHLVAHTNETLLLNMASATHLNTILQAQMAYQRTYAAHTAELLRRKDEENARLQHELRSRPVIVAPLPRKRPYFVAPASLSPDKSGKTPAQN